MDKKKYDILCLDAKGYKEDTIAKLLGIDFDEVIKVLEEEYPWRYKNAPIDKASVLRLINRIQKEIIESDLLALSIEKEKERESILDRNRIMKSNYKMILEHLSNVMQISHVLASAPSSSQRKQEIISADEKVVKEVAEKVIEQYGKYVTGKRPTLYSDQLLYLVLDEIGVINNVVEFGDAEISEEIIKALVDVFKGKFEYTVGNSEELIRRKIKYVLTAYSRGTKDASKWYNRDVIEKTVQEIEEKQKSLENTKQTQKQIVHSIEILRGD